MGPQGCMRLDRRNLAKPDNLSWRSLPQSKDIFLRHNRNLCVSTRCLAVSQ
jgi:hypothetical protein